MSLNSVTEQLGTGLRHELHDHLYGAADGHLELAWQSPPGPTADQHYRRAAELLERALTISPDNWNALWSLGKARQALEEHEAAYDAFAAAYALQPDHPDVCRELCQECIVLGRSEEAVATSRRACELEPDDPGLLANLALAYLIDGQVDAALASVREAVTRDPADEVTSRLRLLVEAVAAHEIEAPTKWPPEPAPGRS